jgi:hypothetical protein
MDDKAFLSQVKGFTPIIDVLAEELGMMTALVYGIVWRYCQMGDQVCRASKETIATHADISPKTVQRHLHKLVEKGYLEDTTPDWKHKPHIYKDTGKVQINGLVEARLAGRSESPTSKVGGSESPTKVGQKVPLGGSESLTKKESRDSPRIEFDSLQQANPDNLPSATDGHQLAVDRGNGSKRIDGTEEIIKHLRWLCVGRGSAMPKGKELGSYRKAARALLEEKINTDDWQGVCHAIDDWKEYPPEEDIWQRDRAKKPHVALDCIAAHYWRLKNGGKHATHQKAGSRSGLPSGRRPPYRVADPARFASNTEEA